MVKKQFWKKAWFPGAIISIFFLSLGWTGIMSSLEWQMYGLGTRLSPPADPGNNLQIIAIDEASLQQLGEWPWPRSYLATIIKHLNSNGAKTIGLALPLHTAQSEFGVRRLDSMRDTYKGKYKKTVKDILFLARQRLDTDGALATSLKRSDNTVLAITYGLSNDAQTGSVSTSKRALNSFAISNFEPAATSWSDFFPSVLTSRIPALTQAQTPIPKLAKNSDAGMLDESVSDNADNLISPLVLKLSDHYYPSFSLTFAAKSLKIKPDNIIFTPGQNIRLGDTVLDTDPAYRIYPRIYDSPDGQPAFKVHSFNDIYANNKNYAQFKNKDVLIGITATSLVDQVAMPDGNTMAPLIINAHIISNLLHGDMFAVPEWALLMQLVTLLIIALYLAFILPKLHLWIGFVISLLLLFIIVNIQLGMMLIGLLWIPLMLPTVTLLTGVLVIAVKRKIEDARYRTAERMSESNLTLGQHLQAQGQLDQAFEKYRKCPINDTLLDRLYNLGLDYERRRQFNKGVMVFEHISHQHPGYRDIKQRIQKNCELQDIVLLQKSGNNASPTSLILTKNGVQKPMLGRYQIDKEIGRGAMGMVYLGKDPKINRTVAIKTMDLAHEFNAEDLDEIKQRFMREAETAGRLNHQNIVTIYDVGEEQDLAYIAMAFLTGKDLSHHRKPDALLPIKVVLGIGIQVASALDFAHKHDVVHRDIKPANIIYDESTGSVKVTDFGVACLTNSSKTKTGTMLGSPSYMSPEQAEGKKVDGGSDLFSLGVTLYQLSTGKLPFTSETLSGLIYKICNEKPVDAAKISSEVPACFSRVINKAIHKQREERYKTGAQMAKSLRKCLNSLQSS